MNKILIPYLISNSIFFKQSVRYFRKHTRVFLVQRIKNIIFVN